MRVTPEQIERLTSRLISEGNPRQFIQHESATADLSSVPSGWRACLYGFDDSSAVVEAVWSPVRDLLPATISAILKSLQGLVLLDTDSRGLSLAYLFSRGDQLYARRGFPPTQSLPALSRRLSVDLAPLYAVHDGWFDLFSYETGWVPSAEWEVIGSSRPGLEDGFLQLFRTGSNSLGFDLSEEPSGSFVIWSDDDEVEPVDKFWEELDEWIAGQISRMDSRSRADLKIL